MANKKESLKSISKNEAKVMLLVIGMQNDKYRPACTFLPKDAENKAIVTAPELLLHVNRCIDVARAREWKVVFALDLHHPRHVSFQKHAPHCVLQTWGS
jgi:nicotinamidase-related amidase